MLWTMVPSKISNTSPAISQQFVSSQANSHVRPLLPKPRQHGPAKEGKRRDTGRDIYIYIERERLGARGAALMSLTETSSTVAKPARIRSAVIPIVLCYAMSTGIFVQIVVCSCNGSLEQKVEDSDCFHPKLPFFSGRTRIVFWWCNGTTLEVGFSSVRACLVVWCWNQAVFCQGLVCPL